MDEYLRQVRDSWDAGSDAWYERAWGRDGLECLRRAPASAFPAEVWRGISQRLGSLTGARVCVPSSGDNAAAIAFALMGARVTSCDIAPRQLENARRLTERLGLSIDFIVGDSTRLSAFAPGPFDLIYTSNGVLTWISDLEGMFGEFRRALRPGGWYIFFDTHPMIRPFDDSAPELRVRKRYDDTAGNDWRVQDIVNALIASGFTLDEMRELHADWDCPFARWWPGDAEEWARMADWRRNPYAALPQWLSLCARRVADSE